MISHKCSELPDAFLPNIHLPSHILTKRSDLKPTVHSILNNNRSHLPCDTHFLCTNKPSSTNTVSVRCFTTTSKQSKSCKEDYIKNGKEHDRGSKCCADEKDTFDITDATQYWETNEKQISDLEVLQDKGSEREEDPSESFLSEDSMKYWETTRRERLQQQLILQDVDVENCDDHIEYTFPFDLLSKSLGTSSSEYQQTDINKTKPQLTHTDDQGKADMVDIGYKPDTQRTAEAQAVIFLGKEAFSLVKENKMKKGDVFSVSQLAGIMAAKKTSDLIPLCHNINLSKIDVSLTFLEESLSILIKSQVKTYGRTGVEMEALTAVSMAALTVYDMCKAVTREMVISDIKLLLKTGGQRGDYSVSDMKVAG